MVKEKYMIKEREINLGVTNGEIASVIKKSITQSACRAYDQGKIGVAGKLGEADEELMNQAVENLKLGIPYEGEATVESVRQEHRGQGDISVEHNSGFLKAAEEVLSVLKKEYPQVIFSNKIRLAETEEYLTNDGGTDLAFSDRIMSWELLIKHEKSLNIIDDAVVLISRTLDAERFLKEAREHLDAFLHPVELPEKEELPVIVNFAELGEFLIRNLDAQAFGRGTSFFNGKLGQKLFDEKFSLYVDRSMAYPGSAFFDAEGSTCRDDRCGLIQNGVLVRPFADKKTGKEFGYENTATAGGGYDSVPSNTAGCFSPECGGRTLKELMGEEDGIYITMMSGGDYTSEGNFATPVQTAYLYRGGRLVGRLPEFGLSGSIYEMFGKNFVGVSADRPYEGEHKTVIRMKVQKTAVS